MGAGRAILLSFLSAILILAIFLLGVLWSIHAFLYPQIYEQTLEDNNIYSMLNTSQIPGGSFIKIPTDGIKGIVNNLLENTLSYLRGDSAKLNLTVTIDNSMLQDFIVQNIESLPVCKSGENPVQNNLPTCLPPGINATEYLPQILEITNFSFPKSETVNLADVFGIKQSDTEQIRNYVILYQKVLYAVAALVALLFILMIFISPTRTRWQGISFVLGGALVSMIGYIAIPFVLQNIPMTISFVSTISKQLADFLSQRTMLYARVFMGAGVVLFAISLFFGRKSWKKKEVYGKNTQKAKWVVEREKAEKKKGRR
jgi:hypothetical protein